MDRIRKWAGLLVATVLASIALGGCGWITLPGNQAPPAAIPTIPAALPTAMATVRLPTPSPAPLPTISPTPATPVTQEEAQLVVLAWYTALATEDYDRAEQLTWGAGASDTRQVTDTLRREESDRNVKLDVALRSLDMQPAAPPPDGQAVRADFVIDVLANLGLFSVQGQHMEGNATFTVQRVDGEPRITDIREVVGLPAL